jgi:predicted metal-dependent HD superfamily phosphohydrolase
MSEMVKHYTKNRCYHGLDHIVHCYQELEWAIVNFNLTPDIYNNVAIGILAHDIFYNEKNIEKTDEELSAIWLDNYLDSINFENKTSVNLVLSTAHLSGKYELKTEQEKLMSSIDLAILAQKHDEYKWYANGIRKEYSFVDDKTFNYGRIQALEKLSSGKIYHSVCFSKYEQKALNNINKEINYLKTIINND